MRTRDAYLILRFLTWPPALLTIVGLIVLGAIVNGLGLNKPAHPTDYVCLGQKEYDLNDPADKEELLGNMSGWDVAPSKVLQRPPCGGFGSPISQMSIDKLFNHQRGGDSR